MGGALLFVEFQRWTESHIRQHAFAERRQFVKRTLLPRLVQAGVDVKSLKRHLLEYLDAFPDDDKDVPGFRSDIARIARLNPETSDEKLRKLVLYAMDKDWLTVVEDLADGGS